MRASYVAGTALMLITTLLGSAEAPQRTLDEATDLMSSPDGTRVAVLLPGARVEVLENRPGWARVLIEGWVRVEENDPAAGTATAAPTQPAPRETAVAPGSISGAVFVTDQKGRTTVGASLALRLLTDPQGAAAEAAAITSECDSSTAALRAEAEALKAKGSRAMKTIENPTMAFEAYDQAKAQRLAKLREIKALDERCNSRIEAALDGRTFARALSDTQGHYIFDMVPPGRYTLHALLESADVRHVWDIELAVETGKRLNVDLTNANRARTTPVPVYR